MIETLHNSTLAIGAVWFFSDNIVINESAVRRMNIGTEKFAPAIPQNPGRYLIKDR